MANTAVLYRSWVFEERESRVARKLLLGSLHPLIPTSVKSYLRPLYLRSVSSVLVLAPELALLCDQSQWVRSRTSDAPIPVI